MTCHLNAGLILRAVVTLAIVGACLVLPAPLSAQEPKPRATFEGHTGTVWYVAFSADGKSLASVSSDNTIRFWDVATGREQATLKMARSWVDCVAKSPDGKMLAWGTDGGTIKLWDFATRKDTTLVDGVSESLLLLVFSSDGKTLASGGICKRQSDCGMWPRARTLPPSMGMAHGVPGPWLLRRMAKFWPQCLVVLTARSSYGM